MGTYSTTPSLVLGTGEDLQKRINANKEELIGKPILNKFGADLPYLPKVNYTSSIPSQTLTGFSDTLDCQSPTSSDPPRQRPRSKTPQERPAEVR